MPLEAFPGALADPKGYVLFQSFSEHMIGPELTRCGSAIDPSSMFSVASKRINTM